MKFNDLPEAVQRKYDKKTVEQVWEVSDRFDTTYYVQANGLIESWYFTDNRGWHKTSSRKATNKD